MIVEAIDKGRQSLGRSKVVRTIPADRNTEIFVEEQQWLEEHLPSAVNDKSQDTQEETYQGSHDPQPLNESDQTGADRWDGTMSLPQKPKLLAFFGGFFTCCLAFVLCCTGVYVNRKIRRRQKVQGYMQIEKDDREDDYELDGG